MSADFWRTNTRLEHITPPGTRFPEGFDVIEFLRDEIPSGSVLDFGCGDGRLAPAFSAERYVGVDVNLHAVAACREKFPGWRFDLVESELPQASTAVAWTVLLHIDDGEISETARRLVNAAPRVLVAEILGRKWRGGTGLPVCYNRGLSDYERIFAARGVLLSHVTMLPYLRYGGVVFEVMDFRRE